MAGVFDWQISTVHAKLCFSVIEVEKVVLVSRVCPAAKHQYLFFVGLNAGNSCSLNYECCFNMNLFPKRALTESRKNVQSLDGLGPVPLVSETFGVATEHVDPLFFETAR